MATNGICRVGDRWRYWAADGFVLWKMDDTVAQKVSKSHRRIGREMKLLGIQNLFGSMQSMPIFYAMNLCSKPGPSSTTGLQGFASSKVLMC